MEDDFVDNHLRSSHLDLDAALDATSSDEEEKSMNMNDEAFTPI
jgi:hypothetical protein